MQSKQFKFLKFESNNKKMCFSLWVLIQGILISLSLKCVSKRKVIILSSFSCVACITVSIFLLCGVYGWDGRYFNMTYLKQGYQDYGMDVSEWVLILSLSLQKVYHSYQMPLLHKYKKEFCIVSMVIYDLKSNIQNAIYQNMLKRLTTYYGFCEKGHYRIKDVCS